MVVAQIQKVLQFQSRGTLVATEDLDGSEPKPRPLPTPITGVPGNVGISEPVLFFLKPPEALHWRYWVQQCLQALDSVPLGWNSASWLRGIV